MNSTCISLLERVRREDEVAWSQFVDLYSPLVYYWCNRISKLAPDDAADVIQEVFKSVSTSIGRFRRSKPGQFRGWLRVITENKVRDFHRRLSRRPVPTGGSTMQHRLAEVPSGEGEDDVEASTERAIITRRALELMKKDFDESSWQAFWKSAVDGMTASEIASELGVTKAAVWQACYRIRKRLREELEGLLD